MKTAPLEAPSTETPDGSALALKGVGQFNITMGWILFIILVTIGIASLYLEVMEVLGIISILVGMACLARGYMAGAKAKATAKAAIEAAKAAERTARMEQMMVNMVNGAGQIAQPQRQPMTKCPKCGASINGSANFCPECGASTKAKCAKCGAEIVGGAKFCPECGTKVDEQENAQASAISAKADTISASDSNDASGKTDGQDAAELSASSPKKVIRKMKVSYAPQKVAHPDNGNPSTLS